MPGSLDTRDGWYADATHVNIPNSNFSRGFTRRDAVVLHIAVGSEASVINEFSNPLARVSSHFLVSKAGRITQFVSVLDTAYANGLSWDGVHWVDPEGLTLAPPHAPPWAGLRPPLNPNSQTCAIEREGKPADKPTLAMTNATIRLLQWLGMQFTAFRSYVPHQNLIGHCEISPVNRANCPGPNVNYNALAVAGSMATVYTVGGLPIYQRQDLTGTIAGYLIPGELVTVDMLYDNGTVHLADGRGFVRGDGLVRNA